jgi:chromosome segregation ATPase
MDSSLIVSIVIAVVAIVPGVWALVNQANKDKTQAKLDMNTAAQNAAMNIIAPLQAEVTRLQARVLELEKALIDKTNEIGDLMQSGIDKDSEIRTLKYRMVDMQTRLDTFEIKKKGKLKTTGSDTEETEEPTPADRLREELDADKAKKEEIKNYTQKSIEHITNGSLVNQLKPEENPETKSEG